MTTQHQFPGERRVRITETRQYSLDIELGPDEDAEMIEKKYQYGCFVDDRWEFEGTTDTTFDATDDLPTKA